MRCFGVDLKFAGGRTVDTKKESRGFRAARTEQPGEAKHFARSEPEIKIMDRIAPAEITDFQKSRFVWMG